MMTRNRTEAAGQTRQKHNASVASSAAEA